MPSRPVVWVHTEDVRVGDRIACLLSDAEAFPLVTGWSDRLLELSRRSPDLEDVVHRTFTVFYAPWWVEEADLTFSVGPGRWDKALIVRRESGSDGCDS